MALTVEDGTALAAADSYVTLVELRAYATDRDVTLDVDDAVVEAQARKAVDYTETFSQRFQGYRASKSQALSWPRTDVYIDGYSIGGNEIPARLKAAQMQLVTELASDSSLILLPTRSGGFVVKEKVGPIEQTFSESAGTTSATPDIPSVDALIGPLLIGGGSSSGGLLQTVRV